MAEESPPENISTLITQMRDWVNKQPHLPKDIDDQLLLRFLHSCYYDLEKAKAAADLFFTIRGSSPELLNNRDPQSPQMQKTLQIVNLAQLKISGNRNLWIWQLNDPGLDNYDYVQDAKLFFLSTDSWLLDDKHFQAADIVLMDVKDISLKFVTKFNVSAAKKLSKYQGDAMPIRLKQVHLINAPPFIDKLFSLMKPFMKQEVTEMMHFHSPKSDSIYEYFTKEDLPSDYGGTSRSMKEHMVDCMATIMRLRETLIDEKLWRSLPMDKKSKKNKEKEYTVEPPAFRSLDID